MPLDIPTFEVGDSFELKNEYGQHLHVIVAEESPDKSATIFLIYISSKITRYMDSTTIIQPGEHTYVTKRSWVRYQHVIICARNNLPGSIIAHYEKVHPELLKRIQDGIVNSDRVNDRDKSLYNQWTMDKLFREISQ